MTLCGVFQVAGPLSNCLRLDGMRCGTMKGGVLWCSSNALDFSNTQSLASGFDNIRQPLLAASRLVSSRFLLVSVYRHRCWQGVVQNFRMTRPRVFFAQVFSGFGKCSTSRCIPVLRQSTSASWFVIGLSSPSSGRSQRISSTPLAPSGTSFCWIFNDFHPFHQF